MVFPAVTEPTQPDQLFLERPRLTDLPCAMEHTVAVIKPDVCAAGAASRVVEIAEAAGFFVARRRELRFSPTLARQFYAHLESQPNFRVLVEFLSSGPVVALVLTKVGAVKAWRTLIGPMDPARAREIAPSSVRALLGADAVRNAVHGSDSDESARREANLLFPPGALEALVPKEYLVETVLPGLVDALGEMYASQPEDGYRWMSHWFQCSAPPPRDMLEDWPDAVLHGGAALVADQSAGLHAKSLGAPLYEGTWNFRRCKDRDPIYGLGSSLVSGTKGMLEGLCRSGHPRVHYFQLRDDPCVFLSGAPVAAKETNPADAFKFKLGGRASSGGASGYHLDRMDARLKLDVLSLGREKGGQVMVNTTGGPSGEASATPFAVGEDMVRCSSDAFKTFRSDGIPVTITRLPLSDEGALFERQLDQLVEVLGDCNLDDAAVFSCRSGYSRTTSAMVAAMLIWRTRKGVDPTYQVNYMHIDPNRPNLDNAEFSVVLYAVMQLEAMGKRGREAKQMLDECIDKCDALENVRQAPAKCKLNARHDVHASEKWSWLGLLYLERYYNLLLFASYCRDTAGDGFVLRFSQWVRAHWNLKRDIREMSLT